MDLVSTVKPRLYLDIDGVLNVFPKKHGNPLSRPHLRAWKTWKTFTTPNAAGETCVITYSPDLLREVVALSDVFDLYWLTDWRDDAVKIYSAETGLPEFPVRDTTGSDNNWLSVAGHSRSREWRWWKVNAIVEDMEENPGLRWAWIDDSIRPGVRNYLRSLAKITEVPSMMITPPDAIGMTPEDINRLRYFATHP